MSLLTQLRSFARFFGIEFRFHGEERIPASPINPAPSAPRPEPTVTSPAGEENPVVPLEPARSSLFVPLDLLCRLPQLRPAELNALDFGCVKLSDTGIVEFYNRWEAEFAGVEQAAALGKNFFRELAPCTNNRLIFGRFKDGVAADDLNTIVSYAFTYKMKPTLVRVHLYRDPGTHTNWILVKKHEAVPPASK